LSKNSQKNDIQVVDSEGVKSKRIVMCLSYNGANYHGWQFQKCGLPTVQQKVQAAISKVANHHVEVVCAGRTDRAVHSSFQVIHFNTQSERTRRSWVFGVNANLPRDISISWAGEVDETFHARFSAISRRYHYQIFNHPIRPANFADEMTWCHEKLDGLKMHEAAQSLVGTHDFTSFRAVGCQAKSPVRTLEFLTVTRYRDILVIDVKGNAFLHHMIRNIAGVLISIGSGEKPVSWCEEVLSFKDRTKGGVTASPRGLFLSNVEYPSKFEIPAFGGAPSLARAMVPVDDGNKSDDIWNIFSS